MVVRTTADTCTITILNKLTEINNTVDVINMLAVKWKFSTKLTGHIHLAIEEVVSNIIYYAYEDENEHQISIELLNKGTGVQIKISDDGKYFNLMEANFTLDLKSPADERKIGGLGIYLTKTLVDQVDYKRIDNKNIVTLTKFY